MTRAEFDRGLEKFLRVFQRELTCLHGEGPNIRRGEEQSALEWLLPILEEAPRRREEGSKA